MSKPDDTTDLKDTRIARRLRAEHELLRTITANLHAAVEEVPDDSHRQEWARNLRDRYEHFRAHMTKRIALEEVGGFMAAIEARRPTLTPQIEHLRREHEEIIALIEDVQQDIRQLDAADTEAVKDCVLRVRMILSEVAQHERRENLLVGFVLTQDIGGLD